MITSIKYLILRDFIDIVVYKKFELLGEGSDEERGNAWLNIMSEYYETIEKQDVLIYLKLVRDISMLDLHKALVKAITGIMESRYSHEGAKALKGLYPMFAFSPESYLTDLQAIPTRELANGSKYEALNIQLKKLEEKRTKEKDMTDIQRQGEYMKRIANINKHNGVKYDLSMTVLEFAILEKQLIDHIESINDSHHGR